MSLVSLSTAAGFGDLQKHLLNDQGCAESIWLCIPLVVETYGCLGNKAREVFNSIARRRAIHPQPLKH